MTNTDRRPIPRFWRLRHFVHRHGQLVAYLLVAGISLYALTNGLGQAEESREALRDSARVVVIEACERDNTTRSALRDILRDNIKSIEQFKAEGTLTEAQAARSIADTKKAINQLPNDNCQASSERISDGT